MLVGPDRGWWSHISVARHMSTLLLQDWQQFVKLFCEPALQYLPFNLSGLPNY